MSNQTLVLTDPLYQYWLKHAVKESEILRELREETQKMPTAVMQISPEQGQFMQFLVKLLNVRDALEIGTFTGYSALCVASALPENGKLVCCDQSEDWTNIAKRYWQKAGLADKIELRLGAAIKTLDQLLNENKQFDFIFIDADKINYLNYFDRAIQMLRPTGLMLIDNVFFGGGVAMDDSQISRERLPATRAMRAINERLANEPGIELCMLPIGDGLTLLRKK
ncbi:MAG: putative O-methyltransferase [Gammaproteobacteria bacterium]|jgi:predicted O-methyltransferase YrrM|nr:putative O-methyltransferase [Gammaproteobacteria bacterium]